MDALRPYVTRIVFDALVDSLFLVVTACICAFMETARSSFPFDSIRVPHVKPLSRSRIIALNAVHRLSWAMESGLWISCGEPYGGLAPAC
jgi:hypothetical protein